MVPGRGDHRPWLRLTGVATNAARGYIRANNNAYSIESIVSRGLQWRISKYSALKCMRQALKYQSRLRQLQLYTLCSCLFGCQLVINIHGDGRVLTESERLTCDQSSCRIDVPAEGLSENFIPAAAFDNNFIFFEWSPVCADVTSPRCEIEISPALALLPGELHLDVYFVTEYVSLSAEKPYVLLDNQGLPIDTLQENYATTVRCVKDLETELVWEVKTNDGGLQDAQHTYTHTIANDSDYDSADYADRMYGARCFDANADGEINECHTEDYVARVNQQGLCGANDWRLPNFNEALSLERMLTVEEVLIGSGLLNGIKRPYWTRTSRDFDDVFWTLEFWGYSPMWSANYMSFAGPVRLLRSDRSTRPDS